MTAAVTTTPGSTDHLAKFQGWARRIGMIVAIGGLVVLAGRMFHLPLLTGPVAGVSMTTGVAAIFVLAGASLWLVAAKREPAWATLALTLVWGAAALAAIAEQVWRGRVPTTELSFVALAVAIAATPRAAWLASGLTTLVLMIAGVGCLGYLYGVRALSGISAYATMAPHTALLLTLLAAGLLLARPTHGFMATLASGSLGGTMARRLLPVAVMAPALAALFPIWGQRLGLYELDFGVSVFVLMMIAVLSVVILRSARHLILLERERREAQTALRAREAHMNTILETSLDAVISMDERGRITLWNRSAEAVFGWPREEVLGKKLAEIVMPVRLREPHRRGLTHFLATGEGPILGRRIEVTGLHRDGREFPVELAVVALDDRGTRSFNAFIADITERKRAEAALRTAEEHKTSLLRLSRALEQTSTLPGVIEAAREEIDVVMGYRILWAYLLSDDGRTASLVDAVGVTGSDPRRELPELPVTGDRFLETVLSSSEAVVVEDAPSDPRTNKEVVKKIGSRTIVAVPLALADRHIGILGTGTLNDEGIRVPTPPQLDYFAAMSGHIAVAFDRVRLLSQRERAVEEARALNAELNARVVERTAQLQLANRELEAFSYSVSHDLRAPLRHIDGFSKILLDDYSAKLDPSAQRYLALIRNGASTMGQMIDDLLQMARVDRREMVVKDTDLNLIVQDVVEELQRDLSDRAIEWDLGQLPVVACDPGLIRLVFANLLSNAVKYTRTRQPSRIRVGRHGDAEPPIIVVSDNGAGFDQRYADKLFGVFQRLHRTEEFEGTGIGLATVQRIVQKHGGRVWAEAAVDQGATFYFTLGSSVPTMSQQELSEGRV